MYGKMAGPEHLVVATMGAQIKRLALEEPGLFRQLEGEDGDGSRREQVLEEMAVS